MVRKIQVPEEISKPIRDAEIANQELLRNQQEKLRADGAAEKMEAETKINQRMQQIEAETAASPLGPGEGKQSSPGMPLWLALTISLRGYAVMVSKQDSAT